MAIVAGLDDTPETAVLCVVDVYSTNIPACRNLKDFN